MVTANDVLKAIFPKVRDSAQESRIRALYARAHSGYETNGASGIKSELETDYNSLNTRFETAMNKVKKDTGF